PGDGGRDEGVGGAGEIAVAGPALDAGGRRGAEGTGPPQTTPHAERLGNESHRHGRARAARRTARLQNRLPLSGRSDGSERRSRPGGVVGDGPVLFPSALL